MAFARVDERGRIIEWSRERIEGFEVEFSNGEEVDELCTDGLEDFIIEEGKAVFRPTAAKQVAELKRKLEETDYIASKAFEEIVSSESIADLLSALAGIRDKYAERIEQRNAWRDELRTLGVE